MTVEETARILCEANPRYTDAASSIFRDSPCDHCGQLQLLGTFPEASLSSDPIHIRARNKEVIDLGVF